MCENKGKSGQDLQDEQDCKVKSEKGHRAAMRRIECKTYPECLERAARENRRDFTCDGCGEYAWEDPTEKEETDFLKTNKGEGKEIDEKRICTKCGKEKPFGEFNKGSGKYGIKSKCRQCEADYFQEYKVRKAEGKVRLRKKPGRKAKENKENPITKTRKEESTKKAVEKEKAMNTDKQSLSVPPDRAHILAEEHWAYVAGLIAAHNQAMDPDEKKDMRVLEFHYKSAMVHGYKHGQQDAKQV